MKKIYLFLFGLVLLSNCEDPIDITLNNNTEILVVEAYINWVKESQIVEQGVILSLSSGYFESNYKAANNAKVSIEDEIGNVINFFEKERTGHYFAVDTLTYEVNKTYTLKIEYKGQNYIAKESLKSVSKIDRVEQESVDLFGNEAVQLQAYTVDPENERNYSFFEFTSDRFDIPEYNVYRDDFSNGGEYYGFLLDSDLKKGDIIRVRQYGLSNIAYNYWYLLIFQNTEQGGPFATPPVNLVGNILNKNNPQQNPLGYFRVSEVSEINYIVK